MKVSLLLSSLGLAVLCLGTSSSVRASNLVSNGSFETGDFTGWTQFGDTGYTGVTGNFDGVNPEDASFQAYFGPVGDTGGISQTIIDSVGTDYGLTFWLYNFGGTGTSFTAMEDSNTLVSLTDPGSFGYTKYSFDFTGTGSDTIAFTFEQSPSYFLLDNVSVGSPSAVPEPSSLLLLGTGLAGLAGMAGRKLKGLKQSA